MEMKNTTLMKWTKMSISTGQICPKDMVKNVRLYQLNVYHLHETILMYQIFANAIKS
jgi:hypothetical protein